MQLQDRAATMMSLSDHKETAIPEMQAQKISLNESVMESEMKKSSSVTIEILQS